MWKLVHHVTGIIPNPLEWFVFSFPHCKEVTGSQLLFGSDYFLITVKKKGKKEKKERKIKIDRYTIWPNLNTYFCELLVWGYSSQLISTKGNPHSSNEV